MYGEKITLFDIIGSFFILLFVAFIAIGGAQLAAEDKEEE